MRFLQWLLYSQFQLHLHPYTTPFYFARSCKRRSDSYGHEGNAIGLDAIAMPKFEPLVEQVKSSMKQQLDCTGTLAQSQ
jgi:hypothetical protein